MGRLCGVFWLYTEDRLLGANGLSRPQLLFLHTTRLTQAAVLVISSSVRVFARLSKTTKSTPRVIRSPAGACASPLQPLGVLQMMDPLSTSRSSRPFYLTQPHSLL